MATEAEVKETFALFDHDGAGVHVNEVGVVLRALGYNPPQSELDAIKRNAPQQTLNFQDFLQCVDRVKTTQRSSEKVDLDVIRLAALHYFEKKSGPEIRQTDGDMIRVQDLRHMLTSMGEKLTREEMDELMKELPVDDQRVSFSAVIKALSN